MLSRGYQVLLVLLPLLPLGAADDLDNALWVGYQGWHQAPGDGSGVNKWRHWFKGNTADAENLHGDQWPGGWDEYDPAKLYPTRITYADGSPVRVYSAFDYETVDLHVKWMKGYAVRGAYLQRQQNLIDRESEKAWRNQVARHMRRACEKHGVKFSIMLANNAKTPRQNEGMVERITNDWKHLVDEVGITKSPAYARQEGKPVVAMWGFGNSKRPITPAEAQRIVDFFKQGPEKYRAYVLGGVQRDFLTKSPNGAPVGDWVKVYGSLDMISPWRGAQMCRTPSQIKRSSKTLAAEKAWCDQRGIEYMPVVFPGGSASGTKGTELNNYPRRAGMYLWEQMNLVFRAIYRDDKPRHLYLAMFDEIDEGTAVYKSAATAAETPKPGKMVHNNIDHEGIPAHLRNLPQDWYLMLCREIQAVLDGAEITRHIPIDATGNRVTAP